MSIHQWDGGKTTRPVIELNLDIQIKKEDTYYSAHSLQFDLVATDETVEEVEKAIYGLCVAHIEDSLAYDNTEHLFSPAPPEIWAEYWAASEKEFCYLKKDTAIAIIPLEGDEKFNNCSLEGEYLCQESYLSLC